MITLPTPEIWIFSKPLTSRSSTITFPDPLTSLGLKGTMQAVDIVKMTTNNRNSLIKILMIFSPIIFRILHT
jgi:hypothetical protein